MAGSSRPWDTIIVLSAFAAILAAWLAVPQPARWVLVGWFLVVCPGMALVRLLRLEERTAEWMLAVAVSLSLDMVVGEAMVYAGMWSPLAGLLLIACVTSLAVAIPRLLAPEAGPRWVPVPLTVAHVPGDSRSHRDPARRRVRAVLSSTRNAAPQAQLLATAKTPADAENSPSGAPTKARRRKAKPRVTIAMDPLDEPGIEKRAGLASEGIIRELAVDLIEKRR